MASTSCNINKEDDQQMYYIHLLVTFEQMIEECLSPSKIISSMPNMTEYAAEICKIEREKPNKEAVQMFLALLKDQTNKGSKGWYQEFIKALEDNGYEMLVKSLEGYGEVKNQEIYKRLIMLHYKPLMSVTPMDIMPYLIQRNALNTHDSESIIKLERNKTRRDAMMELLSILSKKKESWFEDLIFALQKGEWGELAEDILPELYKAGVAEAVGQFVQANRKGGAESCLDSSPDQMEFESGTFAFQIESEPTEMDLKSQSSPNNQPRAASKSVSPKNMTTDKDVGSKKCAVRRQLHQTDIFMDLSEVGSKRRCMEGNRMGSQEQCSSLAGTIVERETVSSTNGNPSNSITAPQHIVQTEDTSSSSSQNDLSSNKKNNEQSKTALYERKELNIPFNVENVTTSSSDSLSNVDNTPNGFQEPEPKELELRGYQLELAEAAVREKNVIVEAPTGSGKTHVALYITKKHFENADFADEPKVVFLVPTVALVDQQLAEFKKYLSKHKSLGLSSDKSNLPLNELLPDNAIFVLTPAILLDAIKNGNVKLSQLTLLLFDECHHTTKGHPYNEIMALYIEQKLNEDCHPILPQVVGLTASVGVGKANTQEKARDNIIRLMANLDAEKLCTVNDPRNKLELSIHVNRPDEATLEVRGRKTDPFSECIKVLMKKIERQIKTSPEVELADKEVPGLRAVLEESPNCGTDQYIQWLGRLDRPIATIHLQTTRRLFVACLNHLKAYNNALLINSDCRIKDALVYLNSEFRDLVIPQSDETDKWLERIFREKEPILQLFSEDPAYDNPKLNTVKEKLLEVFKPKPDSRAIIFVKTREMTKALVNWMNETPELKYLNGFSLTGSGAASTRGGMTQNRQEDVVKYFRNGKHKVIVATSVAEEGLDIQKCNLVMRYEHVTNEIAMVQTRGRGRDEDSQYWVIGETGGGIMERERTNKIKESMMKKSVKDIQILQENNDEMRGRLRKYQVEARLEREMKARGMETEEEIRQARQLSGDYQLRCFKCDALAAFSSDFRKVEDSHHFVVDPDFEQRVSVVPDPKPPYGQIEQTSKIYCIKCNHVWGIIALYRRARFSVLKLASFVLVDPKDQRATCKKWKNAPFHVEPLSADDIRQRLLMMANE